MKTKRRTPMAAFEDVNPVIPEDDEAQAPDNRGRAEPKEVLAARALAKPRAT